jgi:hypothetical protein
MALVVRDTVGALADGGRLVDDAAPAAGAPLGVCADAKAAAKMMAKDSFFTGGLDLGEIERFLIFYIVRDSLRKGNGQEGMDL